LREEEQSCRREIEEEVEEDEIDDEMVLDSR